MNSTVTDIRIRPGLHMSLHNRAYVTCNDRGRCQYLPQCELRTKQNSKRKKKRKKEAYASGKQDHDRRKLARCHHVEVETKLAGRWLVFVLTQGSVNNKNNETGPLFLVVLLLLSNLSFLSPPSQKKGRIVFNVAVHATGLPAHRVFKDK